MNQKTTTHLIHFHFILHYTYFGIFCKKNFINNPVIFSAILV